MLRRRLCTNEKALGVSYLCFLMGFVFRVWVHLVHMFEMFSVNYLGWGLKVDKLDGLRVV